MNNVATESKIKECVPGIINECEQIHKMAKNESKLKDR